MAAHLSPSGPQRPSSHPFPKQISKRPRWTLYSLGVLSLWAAACSGRASSSTAKDAGDTDKSPGQKCLIDAAAPRMVPSDAPERIAVSHILVRHAQLDDPKGVTRSREEACLLTLQALEVLQTGRSTWNDAVEKYSDSGRDTAGDLGRVSRDELTPSFGNAAFSLEVDELSYVVESDRGYHIILRTE